jgi:site-specific recombinase XerD
MAVMTANTRHRLGDDPRARSWSAAIAEWTADMERHHIAESTRDRRARHLRTLAAEIGTDPWHVSAGDLARWAEGHHWGRNTAYVYRTSLRGFYRWARRAGRITTDPTETETHPLAKHTPTGWADALADHRVWLTSRGVAASTATTYHDRLRLLARQSGAASPWDLDYPDLSDWLGRHHWSRETARSARAALRSFYGWAEKVGHIDADPAAPLDPVRTGPALPRPASEDAYRATLAAACPRTRLMVRLSAELGLRRAEVAAINRHDLATDPAGGDWLEVHGKGDKTRLLPLAGDLARTIAEADDPAGWLFPNGLGSHLSPAHVGKLVAAALPGDLTMHQLRHRFATLAYSTSHDLFAVQRLMGHSSPTVTQRYVATTDDTLRAVVAGVAAYHPGARP